MDGNKSPIFVSGHMGMVGSAIVREIDRRGNQRVLVAKRSELDLTNQQEVEDFFKTNQISSIVIAAAKVGGIQANNSYPAEFIYENIMIQSNIINSAHNSGIQDLLFLGSSCIYPKLASQPISEKELLSGKLEPTNEPYAIAKIAGIKLCESYNRQYGRNYRSIMPTNLYGPNDNFNLENSHVLPALIRRFHEATESGQDEVIVWGSGKPMREFMHVDDLASASLFVLELDGKTLAENSKPMESHINVGTGLDHSISELAELVAEVTGFSGRISFDTSKPDGPPRKLLNVSLINGLGWKSSISLKDGLISTYGWFLENQNSIRD